MLSYFNFIQLSIRILRFQFKNSKVALYYIHTRTATVSCLTYTVFILEITLKLRPIFLLDIILYSSMFIQYWPITVDSSSYESASSYIFKIDSYQFSSINRTMLMLTVNTAHFVQTEL